MTGPARREYHDRLVALEDDVLRVGDAWRLQLAHAVDVLVSGHVERVEALVADDDALDVAARAIRDEAVALVALQSPVASDLRRLSATLLVSTALERIGELAVNVARSSSTSDPGLEDPLVAQIAQLGTQVDRLLASALQHLARRRDAVAELVADDAAIDRLRAGLHERLVDAAQDRPERIAWAIRLALVASWLERSGDLGVEVGRQAAYIATGAATSRSGR